MISKIIILTSRTKNKQQRSADGTPPRRPLVCLFRNGSSAIHKPPGLNKPPGIITPGSYANYIHSVRTLPITLLILSALILSMAIAIFPAQSAEASAPFTYRFEYLDDNDRFVRKIIIEFDYRINDINWAQASPQRPDRLNIRAVPLYDGRNIEDMSIMPPPIVDNSPALNDHVYIDPDNSRVLHVEIHPDHPELRHTCQCGNNCYYDSSEIAQSICHLPLVRLDPDFINYQLLLPAGALEFSNYRQLTDFAIDFNIFDIMPGLASSFYIPPTPVYMEDVLDLNPPRDIEIIVPPLVLENIETRHFYGSAGSNLSVMEITTTDLVNRVKVNLKDRHGIIYRRELEEEPGTNLFTTGFIDYSNIHDFRVEAYDLNGRILEIRNFRVNLSSEQPVKNDYIESLAIDRDLFGQTYSLDDFITDPELMNRIITSMSVHNLNSIGVHYRERRDLARVRDENTLARALADPYIRYIKIRNNINPVANVMIAPHRQTNPQTGCENSIQQRDLYISGRNIADNTNYTLNAHLEADGADGNNMLDLYVKHLVIGETATALRNIRCRDVNIFLEDVVFEHILLINATREDIWPGLLSLSRSSVRRASAVVGRAQFINTNAGSINIQGDNPVEIDIFGDTAIENVTVLAQACAENILTSHGGSFGRFTGEAGLMRLLGENSHSVITAKAVIDELLVAHENAHGEIEPGAVVRNYAGAIADDLGIVAAALTPEHILLGNLEEEHVTRNLNLPDNDRLLGDLGVSIAWESSHPEIISPAGEVRRPVFGEGDAAVILTAKLTKGRILYLTREFKLTVIEAGDLSEGELTISAETITAGERVDIAVEGATAYDGSPLRGTIPVTITSNQNYEITTDTVSLDRDGNGTIRLTLTKAAYHELTVTLEPVNRRETFRLLVEPAAPSPGKSGIVLADGDTVPAGGNNIHLQLLVRDTYDNPLTGEYHVTVRNRIWYNSKDPQTNDQPVFFDEEGKGSLRFGVDEPNLYVRIKVHIEYQEDDWKEIGEFRIRIEE